MSKPTQLQVLREQVQKRIVGQARKSDTEDSLLLLLAQLRYEETRKDKECERCNSRHESLTEPIAMPSGKLRRVCPHCLAELKPVGGRAVYVKR